MSEQVQLASFHISGVSATAQKVIAAQEDAVNPDVLKTSVDNGIAVVTLGSAQRIFLDEEMSEALTTALEDLAGNPRVRVVVLTGGAPGYFIRHYSVTSLLRFAGAVRNSGREWAITQRTTEDLSTGPSGCAKQWPSRPLLQSLGPP